MMSEADVAAELKKMLAGLGPVAPAEFGKVMGMASKMLAGKAENKVIAAKLKELLG
jgi:uncharacterized protein YqeY